jgi:2-haloacid dehalogenase
MHFSTITFDCYGTLIDWETGILGALRPILSANGITISDHLLLEHYARLECAIEAEPYRTYREVLRELVLRLGRELNFTPSAAQQDSLPDSIRNWEPFPDTVASLQRLRSKYQLAIISNIDDDLFAHSSAKMTNPFAHVITAQQARTYKPSHRNFELALQRIGLPREQILHAAESLYHDISPADALGISNVWVYRRAGKHGFGATMPATAEPTYKVTSLAELADLLL